MEGIKTVGSAGPSCPGSAARPCTAGILESDPVQVPRPAAAAATPSTCPGVSGHDHTLAAGVSKVARMEQSEEEEETVSDRGRGRRKDGKSLRRRRESSVADDTDHHQRFRVRAVLLFHRTIALADLGPVRHRGGGDATATMTEAAAAEEVECGTCLGPAAHCGDQIRLAVVSAVRPARTERDRADRAYQSALLGVCSVDLRT